MSKQSALSLSLLLFLGFIWGTGYSIARFATTHGVPPLGYSFWQAIGPAVLMCLLSIKKIKQTQISLPRFQYYFVSALTGIVIPNTTMYFAAAHLPAGLLAVIVNTVPIMVYCIALLTGMENFQILRLTGILSALCGLTLMIFPQLQLTHMAWNPWMLIALITPLSFAICSIYIARYRPAESDSISLAAGTLVFSSVLLLPLVFFSKNFYALHFPFSFTDQIILLEIILSSIGYVLFFQLIKVAGPVYYSLVDTVVAMTGLFWGFVIFHETLNQWNLMAVIFILIALVLVTQRQESVVYRTSE